MANVFDYLDWRGDLLRRPGSRRIADRVHTFVPQSSIVGMLLASAGKNLLSALPGQSAGRLP